MIKAYRHGDMALEVIDKLPEGLKEKKTNVLMKGSHSNDHSFVKGKFYPKEESTFAVGYFEALEGCTLTHKEHGEGKGKTAKLPSGFYRVMKQNEIIADELKPVVD